MPLLFSYTICIRREAGFCCVQYEVCPDVGNIAYSLTGMDGNVILTKSAVDNKCDLTMSIDYIRIEGNLRQPH